MSDLHDPPPLKAVFLDVGGTLVEERPSRFAIYAEAARERGCGVDARGMRELMRKAHRDLPREIDGAFRYTDPWFRAFIEHVFLGQLSLPRSQLDELVAQLFARFEDPRSFRLHEGARELLGDLRSRGVVVGIVSNWSARLPRLLDALEIGGFLDFVLSSAIERTEKPEPGLFEAALERSGAAPGQALHAGDHPENDVAAAQALGIEAVLVDHRGLGSPGVTAERYDVGQSLGGVERVESLVELHELLQRRLS